jgi:hypothetical protein
MVEVDKPRSDPADGQRLRRDSRARVDCPVLLLRRAGGSRNARLDGRHPRRGLPTVAVCSCPGPIDLQHATAVGSPFDELLPATHRLIGACTGRATSFDCCGWCMRAIVPAAVRRLCEKRPYPRLHRKDVELSAVRTHAKLPASAAGPARRNGKGWGVAKVRTFEFPQSGGPRPTVAQKQLHRWTTDGGALHHDD